MSYLDNEEEIYNPRFREAQPLQLSLASAPDFGRARYELSQVDGILTTDWWCCWRSIRWGDLVLADQTRSNISTAKY